MNYIWAFVVGGGLCVVAQILIDKTRMTPARILVSYVVAGVFLGAVGLYKPFAEFAGAGATTPLTGFGYLIAKGVKRAVEERGILGALTGPLTAAAGVKKTNLPTAGIMRKRGAPAACSGSGRRRAS
jgi:stage V sporulation protein AE